MAFLKSSHTCSSKSNAKELVHSMLHSIPIVELILICMTGPKLKPHRTQNVTKSMVLIPDSFIRVYRSVLKDF